MNNTYQSKHFVVCNKCGHEIENVLEHVKYVLHGHCAKCADTSEHMNASPMELKRTS